MDGAAPATGREDFLFKPSLCRAALEEVLLP